MSDIIRNEAPIAEVSSILTDKLPNGGLFLTTYAPGAKPNTMTIGWGGVGCFFGQPMFYVPVRASRHTFSLLRQSGEFTVSVPLRDMKAQLLFAGTQSGRDVDKFEGHGLTAAPAATLATPIVAECGLHLECRVAAAPVLTETCVSDPMLLRWYADRDMHTLFFGQVVQCYYTK